MNHCIIDLYLNLPYSVSRFVYGPYNKAKCRAMIALLKVTSEQIWRNQDIKEMSSTLENDRLIIREQDKPVRKLWIQPMLAPKSL